MIIQKHFWEILYLVLPLGFSSTIYFHYVLYACLLACVVQTVGRRIVISLLLRDLGKMGLILQELYNDRDSSQTHHRSDKPTDP